MVFDLPPITGFQDLEAFYVAFAEDLKSRRTDGATFDLRATDFFPPEALLSLAAASKLWKKATGQPVAWKLDNQNTLRYLERMDIFSVFADCIIVPEFPSDLWSRTSSNNVLEAHALSADIEHNNLVDVPLILSLAQNLLLGRLTPDRMGAACTLLSEVAQNVTHSNSQGFAVAQVYKGRRGPRVHIGVADIGKGIPATLKRKYPDVGQPSDYLQKSLESGVTSGMVGNGLGLYQVQHIVKNGGGTLAIRSDTAMLQLYGGQLYKWDNLAPIPGTQVFVTIWGEHDPGKWNYLLPRI